jgi:formylglycine-generating enzyme required for sulfatase activity
MTKKQKLSLIAVFAGIAILALIIVMLARSCVKPAETGKTGEILHNIIIDTVSVLITGPATNEMPNTTPPAGGAGYACGPVLWSPNDETFRSGTVYTASVTMATDINYIFSDEITGKINNLGANVTYNNGKLVTISLQFDATPTMAVTSITVKTQPKKRDYIHTDRLELDGLVVTLVYENNEIEDVAIADFALKNITTNPVNSSRLSHTANNDKPVVVSCGRANARTNNLTVNKASPAVTWPAGLAANYKQTLSDISLVSYTNGGRGSFSWAAPNDSVGAFGTHSHRIRYTPTDTANYIAVLNNVNIRVVLDVEISSIPAGTFIMGSPSTESGRYADETQRRVTLSGFYMGRTEVTQEQYETVMGRNPSTFKTDVETGERQGRRPVETVSWYDALVFCNKLSILEGYSPAYSIEGKTNPDEWGPIPSGGNTTWNNVEIVAGSNGYRLPTEAQWEYACRAGTTTTYNTGDTINDDTGWYSGNSGNKTHEVGLKPPNVWGLYDMYGNVFEWCWDGYGEYPTEAQTNPMGAPTGSRRVIRGGGWNGSAQIVRSAYRGYPSPYVRVNFLGFRYLRPLNTRR